MYVRMSAKYNFGYIMRMVGYFLKIVMHINAPMKYFLGFDLIDKKMTIEEANDQKS